MVLFQEIATDTNLQHPPGASDGPDAPTTSSSDSCYHPEENLTSPATQLLTQPHRILGLSMRAPRNTLRFSLSPAIPCTQIQHYLTGLDSTTVRKLGSLISGPWSILTEPQVEISLVFFLLSFYLLSLFQEKVGGVGGRNREAETEK